jgi:hypothetical protein
MPFLGLGHRADGCVGIHLQGNSLRRIQGRHDLLLPRLGVARVGSQASQDILQADAQRQIGLLFFGWRTFGLACRLFLIHG